MGTSIDWLFSDAAGSFSVYPCWMITASVMIAVGYILPLFIVFSIEVFSRAIFLRSRICETTQQQLQDFKKHVLKVGFLTFCAGIVGVWFLMLFVKDLTELSN